MPSVKFTHVEHQDGTLSLLNTRISRLADDAVPRTNDAALRSEINWVIMDYLVYEGYPGAAEKFAQETSMCQPSRFESIYERVRIRDAIHAGSIDEAIRLVNEVDSEVSVHASPRNMLLTHICFI